MNRLAGLRQGLFAGPALGALVGLADCLRAAVEGGTVLTPRYWLMREEGPDHAKEFEVATSIAGVFYGVGQGRSKKEAEQDAAQHALELLE